jgi:hypothetical protein
VRVVVDLRLDLFPGVVPERVDLDLAVEMADVADDGAVLHAAHVVDRDHVDVAGRGDKRAHSHGSISAGPAVRSMGIEHAKFQPSRCGSQRASGVPIASSNLRLCAGDDFRIRVLCAAI